MAAQRWVPAGVLLMIAGALSALSTWHHWAGCRGGVSTPACLELEDTSWGLPVWGLAGDRDPWGTAVAALAAVLLGLAWLSVIGWASGSSARLLMAGVIAAQPLLIALLVGLELVAPGRFFLVATSGWLTWPAEILVVPFLLGAGWLVEESFGHTLRLIVLGWAVTSFGAIHHLADYVTSGMLHLTEAATPPEMGYLTALTQVLLGAVVVVMSLVLRPRPEAGNGGDWSGQDGFTLAA